MVRIEEGCTCYAPYRGGRSLLYSIQRWEVPVMLRIEEGGPCNGPYRGGMYLLCSV